MFGNKVNNKAIIEDKLFEAAPAVTWKDKLRLPSSLPVVKIGKTEVDFNQRKTQIITGVVVVLLLFLCLFIHHVNSGPMVDYPVSPSHFASKRVDSNSHYQEGGKLARQRAGYHNPDGFH